MPCLRKTQIFITLNNALDIVEDDVVVDRVVSLPPVEQGNLTDKHETQEAICIPKDGRVHVEVDYDVNSPNGTADNMSTDSSTDTAKHLSS